ncbi:Bax inhibitor-1/YccA family protein [Agriterribacter sp.]|uniref:Bax inhibitor-1/YccA family protein n=1 Tax=Agriterribacter sp. TaxID=2821509 RepID=UPI002C606D1A|nr:Bax inhibitor-1/YccA family protein [Agriterribacter sp.]HRO48079.1 Bax inhibitor-1/YccA family protein [Agriterribacter sp.]HRQ16102.1 Bax inhibitor-1/YccA family protein [Agriterribacter sp.]
MELFKSGNPTLSEKMFKSTLTLDSENVMTVRGTLNKFGFLFLMVMATAFFSWYSFGKGVDVTSYMWGGAIGGLVVALVIVFKKTWAPFLAPAYALLEGLFVGAISAYYNHAFEATAPYIITQAVGLTFGVAIAMFVLYNMRIIRATETFKSVIITATAGIAIFYLISIVLRFFSIDIPFIHQGSTFGIIFSLFVVAIAALNLILDFDMIERGSDAGAPKYMEWYGAFGLLVTIVWLYLEILRLLAKLNSRK